MSAPTLSQPTFMGLPVHETELLAPGEVIVVHAQFPHTGEPSRLLMHPFDVITIRHGKDLAARLDAVAEYVSARASRELDALLSAVNARVDAANMRIPCGGIVSDGASESTMELLAVGAGMCARPTPGFRGGAMWQHRT